MLKLIVLGLIAGIFFSSTFVLNELMSDAGGHWYWSASLRYLFMFILLSIYIASRYGTARLVELADIFSNYWQFWCITGGIGFGLFYAGICYAGDHASGWVVASTFMFTVVASLFVLAAFGQRFHKRVVAFAVMIFVGVVFVNLSEATHAKQLAETSQHIANTDQTIPPLLNSIIYGALPALVAAFSYPFGNQLVWQASQNAKQQNSPLNDTNVHNLSHNVLQRNIPTIDTMLLNNAFNKIWLMTLGSFPLWLLLGVTLRPPLPSNSQVFNTFLVALLSGVIATGIFLYAREQANTSQEVAGVDATQASEVIFALIGGMLLLGTPLPSLIGIFGIVLIVFGLVLFARFG